MIFVWTNFGGEQGGSLLSLFVFLIPFLLNFLFNSGGGFTTTFIYDPSTKRWRIAENKGVGFETSTHAEDGSTSTALSQAVTMIAFLVVLIVGFLAIQRFRHVNRPGDVPNTRQPSNRSERLALTAAMVQKLPIEVYHTREELAAKSISELKSMFQDIVNSKSSTCFNEGNVLEKEDLISTILGIENNGSGNSSTESCSICCEDYALGDVLRVLPCHHKFHLECVDRWFLSSTDYSRPPSCPMCNRKLV